MSIEVSVIVPVLNASYYIEECINHLLNQSLSSESYEVIIIDNGSTDNTPDLVKSYPVRLEYETSIKSPYAARNRGLEIAKGKVVAFTDADCYADRKWLENGLKLMNDLGADLVGGNVKFRFSDPPTMAEIYDSLSNLEMKNNIREKGVAKTGNLFSKKEVFNVVGKFIPTIRSGGDVEWTKRASKNGFKIIFGEDVIVKKRARKMGALLKKQIRVGKGKMRVLINDKESWKYIYKDLLSGFRPITRKSIHRMIHERGEESFKNHINKLCIVSNLCKFSTTIGKITILPERFLS